MPRSRKCTLSSLCCGDLSMPGQPGSLIERRREKRRPQKYVGSKMEYKAHSPIKYQDLFCFIYSFNRELWHLLLLNVRPPLVSATLKPLHTIMKRTLLSPGLDSSRTLRHWGFVGLHSLLLSSVWSMSVPLESLCLISLLDLASHSGEVR